MQIFTYYSETTFTGPQYCHSPQRDECSILCMDREELSWHSGQAKFFKWIHNQSSIFIRWRQVEGCHQPTNGVVSATSVQCQYCYSGVKVWNNYTIALLAKDFIAEIKDNYELRTYWYISGQLEFPSEIFCDKLTTIAHEFIANLACQHMHHVEIDNAQQLIPN